MSKKNPKKGVKKCKKGGSKKCHKISKIKSSVAAVGNLKIRKSALFPR
jgi:hypothetical protein